VTRHGTARHVATPRARRGNYVTRPRAITKVLIALSCGRPRNNVIILGHSRGRLNREWTAERQRERERERDSKLERFRYSRLATRTASLPSSPPRGSAARAGHETIRPTFHPRRVSREIRSILFPAGPSRENTHGSVRRAQSRWQVLRGPLRPGRFALNGHSPLAIIYAPKSPKVLSLARSLSSSARTGERRAL